MTLIVILWLPLINFNLITLRVVVDKNCAIMCYCLERSGYILLKFEDNQSVPPKRSVYIYIRHLNLLLMHLNVGRVIVSKGR